MTAQNQQQAEEQIANLKDVCTKQTETFNRIFQVLEHEEVVSQNWGNLETDFAALVANGSVINEDFSPQQLRKAKNALSLIFTVLQGGQLDPSDFTISGSDVTINGNPGRDIRRLTRGITAS